MTPPDRPGILSYCEVCNLLHYRNSRCTARLSRIDRLPISESGSPLVAEIKIYLCGPLAQERVNDPQARHYTKEGNGPVSFARQKRPNPLCLLSNALLDYPHHCDTKERKKQAKIGPSRLVLGVWSVYVSAPSSAEKIPDLVVDRPYDLRFLGWDCYMAMEPYSSLVDPWWIWRHVPRAGFT